MLDLKVAGLTLADYMFGKVLYAFYPVKLSHWHTLVEGRVTICLLESL